MTYCVALRLNDGLVLLSDTRTNAGVDNISCFRKMFTWEVPGERVLALMTAGNLAITQAVISQLQEDIDAGDDTIPSILNAPSVFRAAEIVGGVMQSVQARYGPSLTAMGESAAASLIFAGQRAGGLPRVFQVYAAGNFIEATDDTPFFQLGEHKYGRPLLDRVVRSDTPLEDGMTVALLSMSSTLRSNLTVGMPLDLAVIRTDALSFEQNRRIEAGDAHFIKLSDAFSEALLRVFQDMRQIRV